MVWLLALTLSLAPICRAAAAPSGEELFVPPLDGWKVLMYRKHLGGIDLTELVPPNQSDQDWSEMLTIEEIAGAPTKSAADILAAQIDLIKTQCEDVGAGPIVPGTGNGYETALRVVACMRIKGWTKGEVHLYKVVHGRDANYMVSRVWRGPAFGKTSVPITPETEKDWVHFMDRVVLCDVRDPARPCPPAGGPNPAK
jgi:hypothetical protein